MYLFLSTATTGLNPEYDDIIKLSYRIEHNNAIVDQNTFHIKPRRGRLPSTIAKEALDFNGIDIDTLRGYGNPEEACYKFISTLKEVTNKGKDKLTVVGHNIKFDIKFLKARGIEVKGNLFDTMIAEYCIDASHNILNMDDLALKYLPSFK